MKLDYVHDLQNVFRKLVTAFSFPGTVVNIQEEADKIETGSQVASVFLTLAFTLLDGEVSFCTTGLNQSETEKTISRLTYAVQKDINESQFVFVFADNDLVSSIESANEGNLIDPHSSATLIIHANSISEDGHIEISGPGIKEKKLCSIELASEWIHARQIKNKEYPLGIDMIFVSPDGNILALPRTAKVTKTKENV